ncbi:MAG TPA: hypothetical protein VF576_07395 [Rubricoccaceae bacterium]|jgi:hypothetical protein
MDIPDPDEYSQCRYIVFVGTSLAGLRLALVNTLESSPPQGACLVFTPAGQRGEFLDRDAVLALDLPDSTPGPYIAVVRTDRPEVTFRRLAWMARPKLGWGYEPHFISEADVQRLLE